MKLPKMKNKIVYKLFAFFTAVLFIFMLIINGFFYFFFNKQTIELRRTDLREKVSTIANTISLFLQNDTTNDDQQQQSPPPIPPGNGIPPAVHGHMGMGMHPSAISDTAIPYYRALVYYIKLLNRMDMSDIWIINNDRQFLISNNRHHRPVQYNELPPGGIEVINEALQGNVIVADSFSGVLGTPATTAAAPIKGADGSYVGAVLMHSPINEMNNSILYAIRLLLISSLFAMMIALPASLLVSYYCTDPLRKMKKMALAIADGKYNIKTDVHQSDEIGDLASSFDQMAIKLNEAAKESGRLDKARRIFTANVSHELRTPVTVLRASLEALTSGVINDETRQKEYHQQMLNETIYLERLVNDMLELSKLQNPDFKIEMSKFILNDLISDAARAMRPFAAAKQIRIITDISLPPAEMFGDYGRLRQMLIVVLDNAIKFSEPDSEISLQLCLKDDLAILKITDNGCGISPDVLPHIFDRFHKVDNERNKKGTGLGLAIAKQIAMRHGVEIKVDSVLDKGSVFSFIFKNLSFL
ncbi:sensor histidine kinase [Pectinatus haikarae]|uniref:histidine kinase n=1 Tax=Pectinatus haikarae TaxID=349096 RepID=A0ABT9Y6W0_9FIRM|nr:ATP-binding protein [Pectinatus haikarae]MDQ0203265.1 signal transduction histidine kinase [Pectinatus haikarae]